MKTLTDYLGRKVTFNYPPKRIVSFAPAITATLYNLGLESEIVGRTRFCIHPKEKIEKATNVGGTKDMKIERVHELKPDLIIVEKEENTKEMVEELEKFFSVYVFEVQTVEDALKMIGDLGNLTDRTKQAIDLKQKIIAAFNKIPSLENEKRVAYVIWKDPYMVVGKNTYIQSLLEKLGFDNPFVEFAGRYPTVSVQDLKEANLDYLLLATEPYPFQEKHMQDFMNISSKTKIKIVDGEMFWYGVKMLKAAKYFKEELLR